MGTSAISYASEGNSQVHVTFVTNPGLPKEPEKRPQKRPPNQFLDLSKNGNNKLPQTGESKRKWQVLGCLWLICMSVIISLKLKLKENQV